MWDSFATDVRPEIFVWIGLTAKGRRSASGLVAREGKPVEAALREALSDPEDLSRFVAALDRVEPIERAERRPRLLVEVRRVPVGERPPPAVLPAEPDEVPFQHQRPECQRLAGVDRSAISEVATVTARATITAQESITPAKPPRGIGAVRRVISEEPDRPWKAGEVHDELVKRGWISEAAQFPQRGTEAAINRLWHGGELERVDRGRYRATPKMKEVPPED
jgi:hypothetical protein